MLKEGTLVDGKYRILSEIGRGGMSVVYLAINEKANKTWAVKEVRKDGKNDSTMVRQNLITEREILTSLHHPKLPSIIDVVEDDNGFIIVMDYIEGRSLEKILEEEGAQKEEDVISWAKQLCEVLGYLHSQQPPIIYRDLKPANIMLKPDGEITIIDFGTAKKYDVEVGVTTGLGTAGYAAPEQYLNSGYGRTDARTDIYALGMTLYSLLTNIDPQREVIPDKSVRKANPAVSEGLDKIIEMCIQDNPRARYKSCDELMYYLDHIEQENTAYKRKARARVAAVAASLALSVVFGIGGVTLNYMSKQKASESYDRLIEEANLTTDYSEKLELYEKSLEIPDKAGDKEAYLGIIQAYKDNDSQLSVEEAEKLESLVKVNQDSLQNNMEDYVEICFEIGKLYWYYYDYGDSSNNQATRAKSAVKWFQIVTSNADDDYENLAMAKVYANIGIFYRDITTNVSEASDKGKYLPFYNDLNTLIDTVASDENESEIVRLELIEASRSALQRYATKFKIDGVSKSDMTAFYDKLEQCLDMIEVYEDDTDDIITVKKNETLEQMDETKREINLAYETTKDGD